MVLIFCIRYATADLEGRNDVDGSSLKIPGLRKHSTVKSNVKLPPVAEAIPESKVRAHKKKSAVHDQLTS